MKFATLYKSTATGKVQEWNIESAATGYYVTWGQQGGKQQKSYVKVEQKNLGKTNETTLEQQAQLEAHSLWEKKRDSGYRENVGDIELAKTFLPMLAKSYKDHAKKIVWPCFVQPKLDGLRCLANYNGNYSLISRKGKFFNTVGHIKNELMDISLDENTVFDGELYVHGDNFQKIVSAIKRDDPTPDSAEIEYHIYDCFFLDKPKETFEKRFNFLDSLLRSHKGKVKFVDTYTLLSEDDVQGVLAEFEEDGYEGAILRNKQGIYEQNRRSPNLQKVKSFIDEEFEIIGLTDCKGKFEGMGKFICKTKEGGIFTAMPKGTEEQRRKYLTDKDELLGKQLTVKFFDWTVPTEKQPHPVPKFGVGIAVRDYE